MRVAFNALCLQEPGTGAGRYAYHLLRSLGRVDGVTEYAIFSPKPPKDVPDTPSTFTWETVPVTVPVGRDRKSTRLNSSHPSISYAVFCLKKKKKRKTV